MKTLIDRWKNWDSFITNQADNRIFDECEREIDQHVVKSV